nr:fibronectin type III domain-containing protein [Geodermatophilus sabuli]
MSGPAAALGAQVVAARATTAPAPVAVAPAAPASAPAVSAPAPPAPVVPAPATAGLTVSVPRPGPIDVVPPYVPRGAAPELEPRPDTPCSGYSRPRQIWPGVVPGPGTATVSWQADASADVRGYRVQAVSQRLVGGTQPAPPVQLAPQPAGCEPVTVTFAGLEPGSAYVFWLEEEIEDAYSLRWVQAGRSTPVVIG